MAMLVGFTAGYRGGLVDEVLNVVDQCRPGHPTLVVLIVIGSYLKGSASSPRLCLSAAQLALGCQGDPGSDLHADVPGIRGPGPAVR